MASILVVDDTPENIDVLRAALRDEYTVRPALSGETALRIARAKPRPDLILLDVMMPGMDGYEVIRQLKADPATRDIPVIFVTALSDMGAEIRGLELGAADYITKPFNPLVVLQRVRTRLAFMEMRRQLQRQNDNLRREREMVEDIITRMRAAPAFDDRGLRYLVTSVDRTNGDLLLSAYTPDGRQWVLVGDLTGHGLPAAVASPLVSYVFYSHARAGGTFEATLMALNQVMCEQLPTAVFMVGVFVEITGSRKGMRVWNAGMPPCVRIRDGEVVHRLEPQLPPLGITGQMDLASGEERLDMHASDRLYIYSDGAMEVHDPLGQEFGMERLETFLQELGPSGHLAELLERLTLFQGSADFEDDITLVEISC